MSNPIIFDTNIYLSAFLHCTEISQSILSYGVLNFGVIISPHQYREILNVFFRISIDGKNTGNYSYEDSTKLLERFISLKSVEICHPLNVFHLEGEQDFQSYQKLAIKDPKDVFLLDLAKYTNASYLITRDFRLIEALGGSKNNPVFYQTTMVINQGIFARSVMGI